MNILMTGLIYRNSKPHLRSRHAYFPSLTVLANGDLLCGFDVGSAFESDDVRNHHSVSKDGGMTWGTPELTPAPESVAPFFSSCRFKSAPYGELVGAGALWDRSRSEEGLANPETGGFVDTTLFIVRGDRAAHTWQAPSTVDPPLRGPFEICSPLFFAANGEWLWPMSVLKNWEGHVEHGMRAIVLRSDNKGATWKEWSPVMDESSQGLVFWEIKLSQMSDGRIAALCWTHDTNAGCDLPVHYAISSDNGRSFSPPRSTGLLGQTCTPLALSNGKIICFYRRSDHQGLWAQVAVLDGEVWRNEEEMLLWSGASHSPGNLTAPKFATDTMSGLRFGLPTAVCLPDQSVLAAFWCVEDAVANIRYFKISLP